LLFSMHNSSFVFLYQNRNSYHLNKETQVKAVSVIETRD